MIFLLSNEEALREVTMLQLELILVDTNSFVNKSRHQPYGFTNPRLTMEFCYYLKHILTNV